MFPPLLTSTAIQFTLAHQVSRGGRVAAASLFMGHVATTVWRWLAAGHVTAWVIPTAFAILYLGGLLAALELNYLRGKYGPDPAQWAA